MIRMKAFNIVNYYKANEEMGVDGPYSINALKMLFFITWWVH